MFLRHNFTRGPLSACYSLTVRQATFLVTLGLIVLALAGWYWTARPATDPKAGKVLFLETPCKKCGTSTSYSVAEVGKRGKCARCGHEFTYPSPAAARVTSVLVVGVMVGVVLVLLGVWGFVTRTRQLEEKSYLLRCPGCQGKLRYSVKQAGNQGACPRCDRVLTFPG